MAMFDVLNYCNILNNYNLLSNIIFNFFNIMYKIKSADFLKSFKEDIIIVPLAWNFAKEIKKRVKKLRKRKDDKFVICFPKFKIQK